MVLFHGQPRIIWHSLLNKFHIIRQVSSVVVSATAVFVEINFIVTFILHTMYFVFIYYSLVVIWHITAPLLAACCFSVDFLPVCVFVSRITQKSCGHIVMKFWK